MVCFNFWDWFGGVFLIVLGSFLISCEFRSCSNRELKLYSLVVVLKLHWSSVLFCLHRLPWLNHNGILRCFAFLSEKGNWDKILTCCLIYLVWLHHRHIQYTCSSGGNCWQILVYKCFIVSSVFCAKLKIGQSVQCCIQKKFGDNIFSRGSGLLSSISAKFYWFI